MGFPERTRSVAAGPAVCLVTSRDAMGSFCQWNIVTGSSLVSDHVPILEVLYSLVFKDRIGPGKMRTLADTNCALPFESQRGI